MYLTKQKAVLQDESCKPLTCDFDHESQKLVISIGRTALAQAFDLPDAFVDFKDINQKELANAFVWQFEQALGEQNASDFYEFMRSMFVDIADNYPQPFCRYK